MYEKKSRMSSRRGYEIRTQFLLLICCLIGVANSQGDLEGQVVAKEAYAGRKDLHDLYSLNVRSLCQGHPVNDRNPF
jgi:hypothetical protein